MFKQFKVAKALALLAAIGASGHLFAPGNSGGPSGPNIPGASGASLSAYSYASAETTSSSVVTESSVMALKTTKILGLVGAVTSEAVEAMRGDGKLGSLGDGGVKIAGSSGSQHKASTWVRASMGAVDNKATGQEWNGQSYLIMFGGDYRFNDTFCAGLGLSYSRLNARTEFNKGTLQQDTFGINPYFIIVPHKNFNLEFIGGASWTKAKDERRWLVDKRIVVDGAKGVDNKFSASPKSNALFGAVFANALNRIGKARFSGQIGYIMMQSKMGAFNETSANSAYSKYAGQYSANTFKAGTLAGNVVAGYHLTPSVAPFIKLHAQYDVQENKGVSYDGADKIKVGRSAFGGGTGLNFKGDDAISGSLEFDYTKRSDLSTHVGGLRVHYSF